MATAEVFNGNLDQAMLSVRKQMQRDGTMSLLKIGAKFTSKPEKVRRKKENNSRRHIRKKKTVKDSDYS